MVARPGRARTAAASSLNRQTLVESAISSSFGLAPTIGASLAAIRVGQSIQPCLFQLAMRSSPHCALDVSASAAGVAAGKRAERIAVEVDDALGQPEPLAREGQRIGGVELLSVVERHSLGRVTPFCPIYLPARSA